MKLTIEMVPASSWYTNVRSNVSKNQWDAIRQKCYEAAGYVCEICGETGIQQGYKHKVECHEVWEYDETTRIQKLTRMICLCPLCHQVKHAGLTIHIGRMGLVQLMERLGSVNGISPEEAAKHIEDAWEIWEHRSRIKWALDIGFLDLYTAPLPNSPMVKPD